VSTSSCRCVFLLSYTLSNFTRFFLVSILFINKFFTTNGDSQL